MSSWSRSGAGARGNGGSVLPIRSDDDVDFKYHSKPSPPPPRRRSGTQPLGRRRWLWLCLLANIFVMLMFIFSSVLYFPSVEPDNAVVRQALSQSDPEVRSGDEQQQQQAPAPSAAFADPTEDHKETTTMQDTTVEPHEEHTQATTEDTAPPNAKEEADRPEPVETQQPADDASNPPTGAKVKLQNDDEPLIMQNDGTIATATTSVPTSDEQVTTTDGTTATHVSPSEEVVAANGADVEKSPISATTESLEPTTHAAAQPANRIADLIAEMKAKAVRSTSSPANAVTTERSEDLHIRENAQLNDGKLRTKSNEPEQLSRGEIKHQNEVSTRDEDGTESIRQNLVMWLKADEGVEVNDLEQCRSVGAGSPCDVKSWTSQVAQDAFVPATSEQTRPTFIPSVSDLNNLPALYFSCPLVNKNLKLHEYMTLFFVLSPAHIETGVSPSKAQKFFGNSPYGQFLFDEGKPGFLSNGGLRELDEVASAGNFYLLAYRLFSNAVDLRLNRQQWRHGVAPVAGVTATGDHTGDDSAFAVRMSNNAVLSLGNVKPLCDSNAFQGRIAEVLVFDTVLSDDRVALVELYLERKWWRAPLLPSKETQGGVGALTTASATERTSNDDNEVEATNLQRTPPAEQHPEEIEATDAPLHVEGDDEVARKRQAEKEAKAADELLGPQQEADGAPPTFDPEGVFEWTPPQELLARKESRAQQLADEWARGVRESVEAIRRFALGGDVLRAFIRSRKDELLALRQQLFG